MRRRISQAGKSLSIKGITQGNSMTAKFFFLFCTAVFAGCPIAQEAKASSTVPTAKAVGHYVVVDLAGRSIEAWMHSSAHRQIGFQLCDAARVCHLPNDGAVGSDLVVIEAAGQQARYVRFCWVDSPDCALADVPSALRDMPIIHSSAKR